MSCALHKRETSLGIVHVRQQLVHGESSPRFRYRQGGPWQIPNGLNLSFLVACDNWFQSAWICFVVSIIQQYYHTHVCYRWHIFAIKIFLSCNWCVCMQSSFMNIYNAIMAWITSVCWNRPTVLSLNTYLQYTVLSLWEQLPFDHVRRDLHLGRIYVSPYIQVYPQVI